MTQEQNIFYAKRNLVDYIWKSARMENIAVTYPDTDAIMKGARISNLTMDEVVTINNLKHAWQFILETLSYPTNYAFVCELNKKIGANLVYGAGSVRNMPVNIGGTNWIPDLPIESIIKEEIEPIIQIESVTDRALTLVLYLMRKQIFLDGNKRTALMAGNHILISNGAGILTISVDLHSKFFTLLLDFYTSNDNREVKDFLYDNCIDGLVNDGGTT